MQLTAHAKGDQGNDISLYGLWPAASATLITHDIDSRADSDAESTTERERKRT
jgi:hypothetical protein